MWFIHILNELLCDVCVCVCGEKMATVHAELNVTTTDSLRRATPLHSANPELREPRKVVFLRGRL